MPTRLLVLMMLTGLSACAAVGNVDTAVMQTTNRAVGAPVNGPATH